MRTFFKSSPCPRIEIKSRRKFSSNINDPETRVISSEETLSKLKPVCHKIGITRISNITHLDRLRIPNYTVTLPGTEDSIWVYSGKGPTKSDAKASALMEAVERFSSLSATNNRYFVQGSYFDISKSFENVLHPHEVMEPVIHSYHDKNSILDFIPGFDLISRKEILIPAQLVFSRYSSRLPAVCAFPYSHTNGLASGNVLEEAVCQALCEVIERDAVSIADLCCSSISYSMLERMTGLLAKSHHVENATTEIINHRFVDDSSLFSDVDISEVEFEPIRMLFKRFYECGIPLLIKDITQEDIGIPTFIATSAEWLTDEYGYFAKGYGSHPDARIALMRAITEVSQTRASNIQGARDDLKKIRYLHDDNILERKWQFRRAIGRLQQETEEEKRFSEINTYSYNDLLDDIKLILKNLKRAGFKRAIIVDLTNPEIGVPVVRAIVPGLETFEIARLFMDKEIQIGNRAKHEFSRLLNT